MNLNNNRHPRGIVAIAVLVVVVIGMMIYMLQMKAFFSVARVPGDRSVKVERPWLQEHLIVSADKLIKLPKPPKPDLGSGFTLNASVSRDGAGRGTAILVFDGSGEVHGTWNCAYSHENRQYKYEASFKGNIDINKTYSDKSGEDESLLFFITKGTYSQKTFTPDMGEEVSDGTIYFVGWVRPDRSVHGLATITTDQSWSAGYDFATKP